MAKHWLLPFGLIFDSIWRTISILSGNETVRLSVRCSLISNLVFWIASFFGLWTDQLVYNLNFCPTVKWKNENRPKHASSYYQRLSKYFKSCKNQPNRFIRGKDRADLVRLAFFNMVIMALFVCCPLFGYIWDQIKTKRTLQDLNYSVIWKRELFVKLPIHALLAEVAFYAFHGFLHWSPVFYKHVHKIHHRFTAPTAMACVYAHPLEFVFGNVLPIYLGPILCDSHPITCYLWWGLAMLGTCKGHSGYTIMGHRDNHEDHHLLYRYNYGGMGLLDRILRTTPPTTPPPTHTHTHTPTSSTIGMFQDTSIPKSKR